jgi:hypothetical protein
VLAFNKSDTFDYRWLLANTCITLTPPPPPPPCSVPFTIDSAKLRKCPPQTRGPVVTKQIRPINYAKLEKGPSEKRGLSVGGTLSYLPVEVVSKFVRPFLTLLMKMNRVRKAK